jgi:uncharacterized protein with HEPN domain
VRRNLDRLRDILEAIEAIERHTAEGRERFDRDELVRTRCLKHVEIIGRPYPGSPRSFAPVTPPSPGGRSSE